MNARSAGLMAALLATLVAAYFAPPLEDTAVAPTARPSAAGDPKPAVQQEPARSAVLSIRAREEAPDKPLHGGFAAAAWADRPVAIAPKPVAAPPPAPVALPAPVAPALPFKVLGRYVDDGKPALFLQHNDQNLVARAGDLLAGQYRVETLDDAVVTLLHLPSNQKQTLAVGAAR